MKGVGIELLVTDDERTTKLHELLGSRFTNHGQLLLPTFRQYEALGTDEGLLALAKDLCRWLGYKPRQINVAYSTSPSQPYSVTADTILVDQRFREHPLVAGGLLAWAVLRFIAEHHHFIPDDQFIETASIESGLGLWVINAMQPRRTRREKLYHMLDGNWLQLEGIQLQAMSSGEYLRQFEIFTSIHHLFPEEYARSVSKRSLHLLPNTPSSEKLIPMPEPSATLTHIHNANMLWTKIILLSLIVSVAVVSGIFLLGERPPQTLQDQQRDSESLRVIKASLDECTQHASDQLSNYDPNDIFMARQVDATKTRCESLRNQYNSSLDDYQKTYLLDN
jgi:hypothetical protein